MATGWSSMTSHGCNLPTTKTRPWRSPLDHIHETTVNTIRQQLRYSNKTVKEISTELDFPNLSFFGKFVKAHLGMAPTEYRQKNLKEG